MKYGLMVEDYYPYETTNQIVRDIQAIIYKRNQLLQKLDALQREGTCWGNIVEEWRKVNGKEYGPYYRLTYYTDEAGHKPKPDYIPANKVPSYQKMIDNYGLANDLHRQIDRLETDLKQARRHVEQLARFVAGSLRQGEQLVLPVPGMPAAGNTKNEANYE